MISDSLGGELHATLLGAVFGVGPRRLDASWTQTLPQSSAYFFYSTLSRSLTVPHTLSVTLLHFVAPRLCLLFRNRHGLLHEDGCVSDIISDICGQVI